MGLYLNDFSSLTDVVSNYGISHQELEGANMILADYTYENYEGSSYVLFEKDGKLYEVSGSHCSCYGLENQWEPEEVLLEELIKRIDTNSFHHGTNKDELGEILRYIQLAGIDAALVLFNLDR
ncbi:hypothetical protein D3C86_1053200 [compost metagenome]